MGWMVIAGYINSTYQALVYNAECRYEAVEAICKASHPFVTSGKQ